MPLHTNPFLRALGRRLPRGLRALGAWALSSERPGSQPPLVSLIVPIYNVERYLDECLDSLRKQSYAALEIILVNDGSPDGSAAIAARHAAEDSRIHIIHQDNAGLGAARNTGIRHATGDYLSFVDSDDVVPPDGVRVMVASAEKSGSDMVVGAAVRFDELERSRPAWTELHAEKRLGILAEEYPAIVRNNYTWSKLYRASFWRACGLWFREGVAYEDQPIITQLYARASGIDVLPAVTYEWRKRSDKSSISQQTHSLRDLEDRVAAWDTSHQVLSAEAPGVIYDAWLKTLYTTHFHWYLNSRSTVDDDYWNELQQAIARLTARVPADLISDVDPQLRVAVELARCNLRDEFHEFQRVGGYTLANFPAELTPDGLEFRLPTFGDPSVSLPDDTYRMSDPQIPLVHRLDTAIWTDAGDLRVTGWAFFRYVDLTHHDTRITLTLHHRRTGQRADVVATPSPSVSLLPPGDDTWASYEAGSFVADLPMSDLLARCEPRDGDQWTLSLTVETDRLRQTVAASRVQPGGSARFLAPHRVSDAIIHPLDHRMSSRPFMLRYSVSTMVADELCLQGQTLSGRLHTRLPEQFERISFEELGSRAEHSVPVEPSADGSFSVTLPAPISTAKESGPDRVSRWSMRAQLSSGGNVPVVSPAHGTETVHSRADGAVLTLHQSHRGVVVLQVTTVAVLTDVVKVIGETLQLSGRVPEVPQGALTLALTHAKASSIPVTTEVRAGAFSTSVPLTYQAWRFGELILPSAGYTLTYSLELPDGTVIRGTAQVADELTAQLPKSDEGERVATALTRGNARSLQVQLMRPVGPDARGRFRRNQLERSYSAPSRTGPLEGLLIETNFGEIAGCSGAAVHRELRRRNAELPVYWAVKDYSVPVPEGGVPVIRNSPEWFRVLRSAKYFIENMYQPLYHRKPEGQIIITTFHGYPFKQMGHPHWRNLRFSQERIDTYVARTLEWDYLVSPARYATPLLTRDFGYSGPVLEIGYPRNDILQSTDAPKIRTATRESLGIPENVTAVLYAPTFRDYLTVDDHLAPMIDFLDAPRLARHLGDEYVVLVRGHAFNRRMPQRQHRQSNLIDVTDYPDPADLYLASDAAVLDYSSLRFDYGVTGKPMLFLVPDLQRYQDTRGWLTDYEPTAPGPLLNTTEEVASALENLDDVVSSYAETYRRFRQEYLDLEDGRASARLVDAVIVPRGDAPRDVV